MLGSSRQPIFLLVSVLVMFVGCASPVKYNSDYESSVDFSDYESFAWHSPNAFNENTNNFIPNDIVDKRIRQTIESELAAKGFNKVSDDSVDFLVNYSIITKEQIDIHTYNTYNGLAPGWRYARSGPVGYSYYGLGYAPIRTEVETEAVTYTVGTLVVDIIHQPDGKLVWRGTAKGKLKDEKLSGPDRDEVIARIVNHLLAAFPPTKD